MTVYGACAGVSAKWSGESPSHHDPAIPILEGVFRKNFRGSKPMFREIEGVVYRLELK